MTMGVERFVDTNVLLAATCPARSSHTWARSLLEEGFKDRALALSGQVVREYLVVATRPQAANGLGLGQADAMFNVRQFLDRARFLPEDESVRDALLRVLTAVPCQGKQVHDANIAATLIAHRLRTLVTLNGADFVRFAAWIEVVGVS